MNVHWTQKTDSGGLTNGGFALIFGHAFIWEHIVEQDFPFALVLEDGLGHLHPDLGHFICRVAHDLELKWDFI